MQVHQIADVMCGTGCWSVYCTMFPEVPHTEVLSKCRQWHWQRYFWGRGCYFPSGSNGHLAPSYAISRLAHARPLRIVVAVMADIGLETWRGSENSRKGLVVEMISP